MDPILKELLVKSFGLDPNATEDQAIKALKALTNDQQAALSTALGDGGAEKIALLMKPITKPAQASAAGGDDPDEQFVMLERKRVSNIAALAAAVALGVAGPVASAINLARDQAVADNLSLAQARQKIQAAMAAALKPVEGAVASASIQVGEDQNLASLRVAMPQALFLKANKDVSVEQLAKFEARQKDDPPPNSGRRVFHGAVHERALSLRRSTYLGMYRSYLAALGAPQNVLQDLTPVGMANALSRQGLTDTFGGTVANRIAMLAESTSDFANITLDAIHKSLRFFYLDAPRTWDKWLQRQQNSDFKNINRVVLSEAPSMIAGTEGKEINYVVLKDGKETYKLVEYKAGIKLTRQAIINDDMNAFGAIPRLQANSATRLEEDQAYGLLTNGLSTSSPYVMSDTFAVFDSTNHANYTSSGTAISIASLQVGWAAIFSQKGLQSAAFLELQPKFLLVPSSIYWGTLQLINSEKVFPSQSSSASAVPTTGESNPFNRMFTVIPSLRLNAASTTSWYLAADYRDGQINTGELCFLDDEPEPVLRMETDFETEDVKYLVRHTVAGKIVDFRGFYKNAGA